MKTFFRFWVVGRQGHALFLPGGEGGSHPFSGRQGVSTSCSNERGAGKSSKTGQHHGPYLRRKLHPLCREQEHILVPNRGVPVFQAGGGSTGSRSFFTWGGGGIPPSKPVRSPPPPTGQQAIPPPSSTKGTPPHAKCGCEEGRYRYDPREPDQDSVHCLIVPTESLKSEDIVVPRGGSGPGSSAINRSSTHGMDDEVSGITIFRELSTLAFRSGSVTISPFNRE